MLSEDYSKPFSTFEIITKIVDTVIVGKYSLNGLIESISKLTNIRIDCIANTVAILNNSGVIFINQDGFCQSQIVNIESIQNQIINYLSRENLLEKLASAVEINPLSGSGELNKFKLFPKYRGLIQLAISIDLLFITENADEYRLTNKGNQLLSAIITKNSFNLYDEGINPSQLAERLEQQALRGDRAEEYILELERLRLRNHPHIDAVKRVSLSNIGAGFDIQSFDSLSSTSIDKFIEVKSFSDQPGFYWSINEINFAKEKGSAYCLIVVNFSKIDEDDYEPSEIRNPYMIFAMQKYLPEDIPGSFDIQATNFYVSLKK